MMIAQGTVPSIMKRSANTWRMLSSLPPEQCGLDPPPHRATGGFMNRASLQNRRSKRIIYTYLSKAQGVKEHLERKLAVLQSDSGSLEDETISSVEPLPNCLKVAADEG